VAVGYQIGDHGLARKLAEQVPELTKELAEVLGDKSAKRRKKDKVSADSHVYLLSSQSPSQISAFTGSLP
jgi:hypothetical protein